MKGKQKRFFAIMLSMFLFLSCLTSCVWIGDGAECEHGITREKVITRETCYRKGVVHKICLFCGEVLDIKEIETKKHTEGDWFFARGCTAVKLKKCTVCGKVLERQNVPGGQHEKNIYGCRCGFENPYILNVITCKSSYGNDYIKDVADAFNKLYQDEGYYVNVEKQRNDFSGQTALEEMRMPSSTTGYDLVLPGDVFLNDVLNEEYGVCVEELTDVWNSTTINFDGTEGDVIKDVYKNKENIGDIATIDSTGTHVYGFPIISSVHGIATNRRVLEEYAGVDIYTEYPRTTDEFMELVQTLYKKCVEYGIYPIAYGGENASTYSYHTYLTAERQILGKEDHFELKNGYKTYQLNNNTIPGNVEERIERSYYRQPVMEWTTFFWDQMLALPGSDTYTHDVAHGEIAMGNAVFMLNSDGLYNEIQYDYDYFLDDLEMMTYPIHSFVGLKYNLCGAGHDVLTNTKAYDAHCENCDEILSAFCYVWDGYAKSLGGHVTNATKKSDIIAEVAQETGVTLTSAQYDALADARGYVYGGSIPMYLKKDCGEGAKKVAKLFLRMLASEDSASVRAKYGMLHPYYENEITSNTPNYVKGCLELQRMATSMGTVGNYTQFGAPGHNDIGYGSFGKTMCVAIQSLIPIEPSGDALDRDYAQIAKMVLESEQGNVNIRNNFERSINVATDIYIPEEYRI